MTHDDFVLHSQPPPQQSLFVNLVSCVLVLTFALLVAFGAWYYIDHYLNERGNERFTNLVQDLKSAIDVRMLAYEQVLRAGSGLFQASDFVSQDEWQLYVQNAHLEEYFPGIQGLGYGKIIRDGQWRAHELFMQQQGMSHFEISPAGERDFYVVITYIAPDNWRNQRAIGYDMYSEPRRRLAIDNAIATGRPAMSGKVTLVQETNEDLQSGFLMYVAVYKGLVTDESQRIMNATGVVYAPFRMNDLMKGIMSSNFAALKLAIYDGDSINDAGLMFSSQTTLPSQEDVFYTEIPVTFGNHRWQMHISSTSRFISESESTQSIWIQVLVSCFIIVLFSFGLVMARNRFQEKQLTDALLANEKRFRLVIEASPSALFIVDIHGIITLVNAHAEHLFGYARDELLGGSINRLLPQALHLVHSQHMKDYLSHPIAKTMSLRDDLYGERKDGSKLAIEVGLTPIHFSNGIAILATINNVSDRKFAEAQRAQHTAELERINQELDSFAYIASHDLKSPLRGIEQLSQWLSEDLADNQSESIQKYLKLIRSRTQRMESLLDGLLTFSRIGRIEADVVSMNAELTIRDVFALVAPPAGFELKLEGDFTTFYTAKVPFELVVRNLISNAIKHHDLGAGVITVSCLEKGDFFCFTVSDDGPGIAENFQKKVFNIFQTLRSRDEVEGSGIGLSLVKKTVENVGGKVELSSHGRGASFSFTWPKTIRTKELK